MSESKMLVKSFGHEVKDLDTKQGIVIAYANAYGNKDYDGDISAPGSFTKTISEGLSKLKVLRNHNLNWPMGVAIDVSPNDNYGLLTTTKFNLEDPLAKSTFTQIQLEQEYKKDSDLSIGYDVMKRDPNNKSVITEYRLHEYSFLSAWGANSKAIVQQVKEMKVVTKEQIFEAIKELTIMYNANFPDKELANIESELVTLDELKAANDGTLSDKAVLNEVKEWLRKKDELSLKNYLQNGN